MENIAHIAQARKGCCKKCGTLSQRQKLKLIWSIKGHKIDTKHRLYNLRYALISRCYNAKDREFATYQGKGIKVCNEWLNNPVSFYEWAIANGWNPGLSIDRIDPMGNYEPSNCQFITKSENSKKSHAQNPVKGERCGNSKLISNQVLEIRSLIDMGLSFTDIAKIYSVSRVTVANIGSRLVWKHI